MRALLTVITVLALSVSLAPGQTPVWTPQNVAPWNAQKLVYDENRGVMFVISWVPRETQYWELDTVRGDWNQRVVSGPERRSDSAIAYDTARGVAVLFGGQSFPSNDTATYEWNGMAWTRRDVSGPSIRYFHAMAYDSARGVTVLFGGDTSWGASAETWEWNGAGAGSWTQVAVGGGPPAMHHHQMVYDAARGVTVLFGGIDSSNQLLGETWEWDGMAWTQRAVVGPSPRAGHAMAYDSSRGVTVLFGGTSNADTWEWDGTAWTQRLVSGPSARYGHMMAYDSARGATVLLGGTSAYIYNSDIWEWRATSDGGTWTRRVMQTPSARIGHAMAHDSARGITVLFGGYATGGFASAETWEWNGAVWTQSQMSGPLARAGHAMAYDSRRGVTVLFGGYGTSITSAQTWEWDGQVWIQRMVAGPPFSSGHAMAYDSDRGVIVVFGGSGAGSGQTWEWDGSGDGTWTQRQVTGPSARYGAAMVYDTSRGVAVLFGGQPNSTGLFSDETWEFDGSGAGTWTRRDVTGPSPRRSHAMAYDAAQGATVLFGGLNSSSSDPSGSMTWSWDGNRWSGRLASGPMQRAWYGMAYEPVRNATVMFGGDVSGNFNAETWRLQYFCSADLDNDGDFANSGTRDNAVTIEDLLFFLVGFDAGDIAVDLDNGTNSGAPDNAVDINDLLFFLNHFEAGC
jgi:hypothetical protein